MTTRLYTLGERVMVAIGKTHVAVDEIAVIGLGADGPYIETAIGELTALSKEQAAALDRLLAEQSAPKEDWE